MTYIVDVGPCWSEDDGLIKVCAVDPRDALSYVGLHEIEYDGDRRQIPSHHATQPARVYQIGADGRVVAVYE